MSEGRSFPKAGIVLAVATGTVTAVAGADPWLAAATTLVWVASLWLAAPPPAPATAASPEGVRLTEKGVRDLIEQLLLTMPGERVMRPTFGSGLAQLVFQPNSEGVAAAVQFLVQGALQQWLGERIAVEAVDVTSTDSALKVRVQYLLRRTQERRTERFTRPV